MATRGQRPWTPCMTSFVGDRRFPFTTWPMPARATRAGDAGLPGAHQQVHKHIHKVTVEVKRGCSLPPLG
jgi:hypothetical protein